VDFSENYALKCNEEIQTMHFGASRQQLSLHTGVFYYKVGDKVEKKSFGTFSSNLDHGAHAIIAHMDPIFKLMKSVVAHPKRIHFVSDGPTAQYRNRFIFSLLPDALLNHFPTSLDGFVWNYTVAGQKPV